jgi:APA family basic amino acid/polyamine antiporter
MSAPAPVTYARRLGLFSGVMMVIGGIIGAGIFRSPQIVAQRVVTPELTLGVWVLGGLIALAGAFVYAELGGRFPKAGGQYVYLRDALGPLPAFLYAWALLLIIATGAIAAVAVTFADYAIALFGLGEGTRLPLAFGSIILLSAVNYTGVRPGANARARSSVSSMRNRLAFGTLPKISRGPDVFVKKSACWFSPLSVRT